MNMSLGGSKSNALNSAIAAVTRAGVTAVVAAGNENVSSDKKLVEVVKLMAVFRLTLSIRHLLQLHQL